MSDENVIDTEVLVVPESYVGPIVIFYEQDKEIGNIKYENGNHYFFVDSTGVFFTRKKCGAGTIKSFYPGLEKSNSSSPMSINDYPDEVFRVVCGGYKGYKIKEYKNGETFLRYTVYKTGNAKDLKNGGWHISDSTALGLYRKYVRNPARQPTSNQK